METPKAPATLSPARLAACRASLRKAHEANRTRPLSPARRAALEKAQEANRRNWRLTPARLAAMHANARKRQAASVAKFRMTEKRLAANRENIKKAQAAWRVSEKRKRPSYNDLKHGAYARHLLETLRRLGENPEEYEALQEMLARWLKPENEKEQALVRQLGDLVWQRRRVPRAALQWEEERLGSLVGSAPLPDNLSPYETRDRATALWETLFNDAQRLERMAFFNPASRRN
jgi:flagellar biosynthesis GTPase FlhF